MEREIEIPIIRQDDEATMENIDTTTPTLSSSEGSEDWEKISEDWVSLFLDHSRSLESYSQFDTTLPTTNDHFSIQDLVADSLFLHSTNDQLSHSDLVLASSSNIIEDLFGKEDSSLLGKLDLIHPKIETTCAISSMSSLTQVSGNSSSGMDVDLWKAYKEGNQDFPIILKQEFNRKVSSSSKSLKFGDEIEFANSACLPSNAFQGSYCKDEEIECEHEGVSRVGMPSTTSQLEVFSVRHLQIIGNAIKVGLLGRSNSDIKESNKSNICREESFGLHDEEVSKDKHRNHSNVEDNDENGEKKRGRLVRNRESAQLSRERKKIYVDELEDKLQTMTTTIVELNATISHLTAENVNLRRQLGYNYYPAPGIFLSRPKMPMHVLPMGPYPGMVAGRPMYPCGQMPLVPIPRIKTQISTRNSKRTKSRTTNKGGNKKRSNLKVACVTSIAVMGFFYLAMFFGSFDQSFNGLRRADDSSRIGNVQVGGQVLSSLNEDPNPLNNTRFSKRDYGPGWTPLKPGEYGPEREGVPSVHTQRVAKELAFEAQNMQLNAEITTTTHGIESSITKSLIDRNKTLATSSSHDYFSFVKVPLLLESEVVPANTSQYFAASMLIPGANGLMKLYGNLTIETVTAGDKATKKQFEKKRKSTLKKKRENKKQVATFVVKALDNLASRESKAVKNTSTRPFVITLPLPGNANFVAETNNPILPLLQQSLQQLILGSHHDPEIDFVARDLSKKIKPQPPTQPHVDNSKAVAATQGTFYSFTPYDAAPKGPLNSWLFSGLVTEPISPPNRNISDIKEEAMPLPIKNEERCETLTLWDSLQQPFTYNQFLQKKAYEMNTCSVPTLSKLFWGNKELTKSDYRQCLASDRRALHTGMCTELFQFDTTTTTKTSTNSPKHDSTLEAQTMAELMAAKSTQRSLHNVISRFSGHGVPKSRRDPFAVPLLPKKPKATPREECRSNGTYPRTENIVKEQMHNQNLQHGVSSMVVSILVGPEDYCGNSQRKGTTKRWSQIFVVVLVDNQKYVTYSCRLPSSGPQAHVVAE